MLDKNTVLCYHSMSMDEYLSAREYLDYELLAPRVRSSPLPTCPGVLRPAMIKGLVQRDLAFRQFL
jgi:hypothetical protein